MFTRCPSCHSVYALSAGQLAEAAGVVRCGHCGKTFNALAELFAEHPNSGQAPLKGQGMPPLLQYRAMMQPELPGVTLDPLDEAAHSDGPLDLSGFGDLSPAPRAHPGWAIGSLVLGVILAVQLLLSWQQNGRLLPFAGDRDATAGVIDDAERIQVVSRDMHRHPSLDDAIILSATLRNGGNRPVRWPVLEIRLYDPSQQVLGARRLLPEEYLGADVDTDRGLTPGLLVPVIVEFVVGTTEPSGFDFRFF